MVNFDVVENFLLDSRVYTMFKWPMFFEEEESGSAGEWEWAMIEGEKTTKTL